MQKNRDIFKLLEVSGLLEKMDYIKDGATNSYSRAISITYPKIPDQFWNDFNKLVGKEEMQVLLDRIVSVYDKHMSHDVIKQLIKMFSTPFWNEWKQKMPAISSEAGLLGSQWTQELLQSESLKIKLIFWSVNITWKNLTPLLKPLPQKTRPKNNCMIVFIFK